MTDSNVIQLWEHWRFIEHHGRYIESLINGTAPIYDCRVIDCGELFIDIARQVIEAKAEIEQREAEVQAEMQALYGKDDNEGE